MPLFPFFTLPSSNVREILACGIMIYSISVRNKNWISNLAQSRLLMTVFSNHELLWNSAQNTVTLPCSIHNFRMIHVLDILTSKWYFLQFDSDRSHSLWWSKSLPCISGFQIGVAQIIVGPLVTDSHQSKQFSKHAIYEALHSNWHYSDIIINVMASQITGVSIVYSTVWSGAYQRKHLSSVSLAFVRRIHQWPVKKGPVTREMFSFDDAILICLTHHQLLICEILLRFPSLNESPFRITYWRL